MTRNFKIAIAETAPVIMAGLAQTLKTFYDLHPRVIEVNSKNSLLEAISTEKIDLLIVNPTFGGLIHPDDIRKKSLNPDLKIFALEISRINKATLTLYDNHFHITDTLEEIKKKMTEALRMENEESDEKENLSQREKEIISHVVKGLTNNEIADKLDLPLGTVKSRIFCARKKLRDQLVDYSF